MVDEAWSPDGQGLPEEARELVAAQQARVHLRITSPGRHPRTACNGGLGEWWSGKRDEVTCRTCLVAAHP